MQKIYLSAFALGTAQLTKLLTLACQIKIEKEEEEKEKEEEKEEEKYLAVQTVSWIINWTDCFCRASSRFDAGGFKYVV